MATEAAGAVTTLQPSHLPDLPAAYRLLGMEITGGWKIVEAMNWRIDKLTGVPAKDPYGSGGHFSVGYIVEKDGTRAFLKAINLAHIINEPDIIEAMKEVTDSVQFEREIHRVCGEQRLDRVIQAVGTGEIKLGPNLQDRVPYLILELADGDVRRRVRQVDKKLKFAWQMRALHHAAVGLSQLHSRKIAHHGQNEPARKMLWQAFSLTPADRYVVRAVVRYFTHVGDADAALYVAKRIPAHAADPWIAAARIAALRMAGKSPERLKPTLTQLDEHGNNPFDISELASVIGTAMLENGDTKRARKRFRQSLLSPTENSVAQAEWAHRVDKSISLPESAVSNPDAYEARTWLAYNRGSWENSLRAAEGWMSIDPLNSAPFVFGSFLAASLLDDPALAIKIANRGRQTNPDNVTLLNNIAVAYALIGETSNAQEHLDRAKKISSDGSTQVTIKATQGLINFRSGDFYGGVENYLSAIERAAELRLTAEWVRALSYMSVEVGRFDPDEAASLAREAQSQISTMPNSAELIAPDTLEMIRRAELFDKNTQNKIESITDRLPRITN